MTVSSQRLTLTRLLNQRGGSDFHHKGGVPTFLRTVPHTGDPTIDRKSKMTDAIEESQKENRDYRIGRETYGMLERECRDRMGQERCGFRVDLVGGIPIPCDREVPCVVHGKVYFNRPVSDETALYGCTGFGIRMRGAPESYLTNEPLGTPDAETCMEDARRKIMGEPKMEALGDIESLKKHGARKYCWMMLQVDGGGDLVEMNHHGPGGGGGPWTEEEIRACCRVGPDAKIVKSLSREECTLEHPEKESQG